MATVASSKPASVAPRDSSAHRPSNAERRAPRCAGSMLDHEQGNLEGCRKVYGGKLSGGRLDEREVATVKGLAEPSVVASLGRHERMFASREATRSALFLVERGLALILGAHRRRRVHIRSARSLLWHADALADVWMAGSRRGGGTLLAEIPVGLAHRLALARRCGLRVTAFLSMLALLSLRHRASLLPAWLLPSACVFPPQRWGNDSRRR